LAVFTLARYAGSKVATHAAVVLSIGRRYRLSGEPSSQEPEGRIAPKFGFEPRSRNHHEEQILAKLAIGPMSVEELVADLYADVDTHLHDLAAGSVAAQLQKLLIEDRVKESAARYELANENYASA